MMKATGMTRRTDDLGRVCLPKELRKTLGIREGDSMEIFVDGETIILRKYEPACCFCGSAVEVREHHSKLVCKECVQEMGRALS